jgi:hypothetical protein
VCVLYGMKLGSVTLKRVVLFCFSTKILNTHSDRCKREYRQYRTWVSWEVGPGWGLGGRYECAILGSGPLQNMVCTGRNPAPLDHRKHRNNAMRCVLVGEEGDGEVMQL